MKSSWVLFAVASAFLTLFGSGTLQANTAGCKDTDFAGGAGTSDNPWHIGTPDQLDHIRHCLSSHFVQINDIDLDVAPYNEGRGWRSIGSSQNPFAGSFRGQGFKIRNLTSQITSQSPELQVGALFSANQGLIEEVHVRDADVQGTTTSGLLAGGNLAEGIIRDSSAEGSVRTFAGNAGVLAGFNLGLIESCHARGSATVQNDVAGGLVASNSGEIRNCWTRTDTQAFDGTAAGFVVSNSGIVRSSWAASTATAFRSGLFTPVRSGDPTPGPDVIDSFYVSGPDGGGLSGDGYPRTPAQMSSLATFTEIFVPELNQPWDLNVWTQGGEEDDGFPVLRPRCISDRFDGGSGTADDPWLIADASHLDTMRRCQQDHVALVSDIDLSEGVSNWGSDWFPLGAFSTPFNGHFDGRGHIIRNARVTESLRQVVGFFGEITGTVENLGLDDIEVSGDNQVGGLAGFLSGSVRNVWVTGNVAGGNAVGGMVGRSQGSIRNAFARAEVSGEDFVGGLVGINNGSVDKAYAASAVSASFFPGGLIALNDGDVRSSFFDFEVAGTMLGGAGTAKPTAQMTRIETFTDAGAEGLDEPWDFIGLWDIATDTNDGYPFLRVGGVEDALFKDRFQSLE